MKTINVGDVYLLHDTIHGPFTKQQLKALHYAFGTLSGRPVLVIRAPSPWDKFGQVTVIPALSKGYPALVYNIEDIFGAVDTTSDHSVYKWTPHVPYSVPVSRLGKYIGSLSLSELKEVVEAFEWIHNPFKQMDPNVPIPKIYQDPKTDNTPETQHAQHVSFNKNFKIQSFDDSNNMVPKIDLDDLNEGFRNDIQRLVPEIINETAEASTDMDPEDEDIEDTVIPFEEATKEVEEVIEEDAKEPQATIISEEPIVLRFFSANEKIDDFIKTTCIDEETLWNLYKNGKFQFSESEVLEEMKAIKMDRFDVTGLGVQSKLMELSDAQQELVWSAYDEMSAADVHVIVPELSTHDIAKLFHRNMQLSATIKELCKSARKLSVAEHARRRTDYLLRTNAANDVTKEIKEKVIDFGMYVGKYVANIDRKACSDNITKLQPYLSYNSITSLPKELYKIFMETPLYMIQQAYNGKGFMRRYKDTLNMIRNSITA